MTPERKEIINGTLVEEFWWGGKLVVYVNHRLSSDSFESAVEKARAAT